MAIDILVNYVEEEDKIFNSRMVVLSESIHEAISDYENALFLSAFEKFESLSFKGNSEALSYLGLMIYRGLGTSTNKQKGVKTLLKAIKMGSLSASKELAVCHLSGQEYSLSIEYANEYFTKIDITDVKLVELLSLLLIYKCIQRQRSFKYSFLDISGDLQTKYADDLIKILNHIIFCNTTFEQHVFEEQNFYHAEGFAKIDVPISIGYDLLPLYEHLSSLSDKSIYTVSINKILSLISSFNSQFDNYKRRHNDWLGRRKKLIEEVGRHERNLASSISAADYYQFYDKNKIKMAEDELSKAKDLLDQHDRSDFHRVKTQIDPEELSRLIEMELNSNATKAEESTYKFSLFQSMFTTDSHYRELFCETTRKMWF